jgi:phosphopantetheine--protein transferase-like protein
MDVKLGIDLLDKRRFFESLQNGGTTFLQKIFTPHELRENSDDQLASIFCVKEAVLKAFEMSPGSWLTIHTQRKENGKLTCTFESVDLARSVSSIDISVSHEGDMVVAVAVILKK